MSVTCVDAKCWIEFRRACDGGNGKPLIYVKPQTFLGGAPAKISAAITTHVAIARAAFGNGSPR